MTRLPDPPSRQRGQTRYVSLRGATDGEQPLNGSLVRRTLHSETLFPARGRASFTARRALLVAVSCVIGPLSSCGRDATDIPTKASTATARVGEPDGGPTGMRAVISLLWNSQLGVVQYRLGSRDVRDTLQLEQFLVEARQDYARMNLSAPPLSLYAEADVPWQAIASVIALGREAGYEEVWISGGVGGLSVGK